MTVTGVQCEAESFHAYVASAHANVCKLHTSIPALTHLPARSLAHPCTVPFARLLERLQVGH